MPGKPDKPHRIRVRVIDGKPREFNKVKGQLLPHVDVIEVKDKVEFVICATKEAHLDQVRAKLGAAGLAEIPGGETKIRPLMQSAPIVQGARSQQRPHQPPPAVASELPGKPYDFVALPERMTSAAPVWHDGTSSHGRLSGELRLELETLTPMLVGWERGLAGNNDGEWPIPQVLDKVGSLAPQKPVLCPLRAPFGERPVIIPGDSLKGLLRHELGALLGAPMERVAERSYSYRPNLPTKTQELSNSADPAQRLVPRLALVPDDSVLMLDLDADHRVRVPSRLKLLSTELKYDKDGKQQANWYRFGNKEGARYAGGMGGGRKLDPKSPGHVYTRLLANPSTPTADVPVDPDVQSGYLATLRHLTDLDGGHFSPRRPRTPGAVPGETARRELLRAAASTVFQPGDLIWVEWDTEQNRVVSLGWHYCYRWAYTDSVRRRAGGAERPGLFPLEAERRDTEDGAPAELSPVRRLFGYTGDNDGSAGIGREDHAQLMGRVSVNSALEVIEPGESEDRRFLPPTFLKELGMPRPSAVEHYLKQPHHPDHRPSDRAPLVTYGDAAGYDAPGELSGRKFYLDRKDAYTGKPWEDATATNQANQRSTLALEASRPGRRFRFTVRFRDLDSAELAAVAIALCPHQLRDLLDGRHADGYCSKLGYARPLGWGSVRIKADALLVLDETADAPELKSVASIPNWMKDALKQAPLPAGTLKEWLAVHRHKNPAAADYPRKFGEIYTFHTSLRAEHARNRRYRPE